MGNRAPFPFKALGENPVPLLGTLNRTASLSVSFELRTGAEYWRVCLQGCYDALTGWLKDNAAYIIGVGVGVIIVEVSTPVWESGHHCGGAYTQCGGPGHHCGGEYTCVGVKAIILEVSTLV